MSRHKNDHDDDQDIDIAGERGGDTGPTKQVGKGVQAEKGDARRDNPTHSGPTRGRDTVEGKQGERSGSDSGSS